LKLDFYNFSNAILISQTLPDIDLGSLGPGSTTYNTDTLIIDILRRGRSTGGKGPLAADTDLINQIKAMAARGDDSQQLQQELIRKYEDAIERNIELESKGDENAHKVSELEAELRRTKERLQDARNAIRKMYEMGQASRRSDDDGAKRSRSLSPPSSGGILPEEAVRSLRAALRDKDNEIEQLERKLKAAEKEVEEIGGKYDVVEEARKRLEKELADARRELGSSQKQQDSLERQLRRLEDKLKSSEYEKKAAETAQKSLEAELLRLRQQFERSSADESRKAREDADSYTANMEQDYENRIDELSRRIQLLQEEKQRLKGELGPSKSRLRELENELAALQRKLDEKGMC